VLLEHGVEHLRDGALRGCGKLADLLGRLRRNRAAGAAQPIRNPDRRQIACGYLMPLHPVDARQRRTLPQPFSEAVGRPGHP
jgi:hypothetical protein